MEVTIAGTSIMALDFDVSNRQLTSMDKFHQRKFKPFLDLFSTPTKLLLSLLSPSGWSRLQSTSVE